MNYKKDIAAYVRNNIEDFEVRLQLALKRMDRMRCPMRMADDGLYDEMCDAIDEWCDDNEVSLEYDEDWDDIIDEIIWED